MAKSKFEIEITRVKGLVKLLDRLEKKLPGKGAAALYQEALEIQEDSMEGTPIETGALRSSHLTEDPKLQGNAWTVIIKCGGPAAPYAAAVHYNMAARHAVGGPLFLERAMTNAKRGLSQRVAERVKRTL